MPMKAARHALEHNDLISPISSSSLPLVSTKASLPLVSTKAAQMQAAATGSLPPAGPATRRCPAHDFGFTNFNVIRSDSPMARYLSLS
jgi:hypothetical protein